MNVFSVSPLTRLALHVVVVPVLAGGDALLGPVVLDAFNGPYLKVGTYSCLTTNIYHLEVQELDQLTHLSRGDIGPHVSEEVLVEGLPDLHEVVGDGPLGVTHRVVEVSLGDGTSGGVIGLHQVVLQVPSSRGWLQ